MASGLPLASPVGVRRRPRARTANNTTARSTMKTSRACVLKATRGVVSGAKTMGNTAWLTTKPSAAKVARRNHDTGRGRDRYRLAVCVPAGFDETRRDRGPSAKSDSSWDWKYVVSSALVERYRMARSSCGSAAMRPSWLMSRGEGNENVVSGVAVPKGVLTPPGDAGANRAIAAAVGPPTASQERIVRIQRVSEGASSQ